MEVSIAADKDRHAGREDRRPATSSSSTMSRLGSYRVEYSSRQNRQEGRTGGQQPHHAAQ